MAFLRIFQGEDGSRDMRIRSAQFVIGRSPDQADLIINDPSVSRVHALILREGDRYVIRDQSSSGTLLNGQRVKETYLRDGDSLQIGAVVLEFREKLQDDPTLADADETVRDIARNFQELPKSMGLNCRILGIKPGKVFSPGDTLLVGNGGIRIDKPFAGPLDEVILELEMIWPNGTRKSFLGEVLVQHNLRLCVKLHQVTAAEHARLLSLARISPWVTVYNPAVCESRPENKV